MMGAGCSLKMPRYRFAVGRPSVPLIARIESACRRFQHPPRWPDSMLICPTDRFSMLREVVLPHRPRSPDRMVLPLWQPLIRGTGLNDLVPLSKPTEPFPLQQCGHVVQDGSEVQARLLIATRPNRSVYIAPADPKQRHSRVGGAESPPQSCAGLRPGGAREL